MEQRIGLLIAAGVFVAAGLIVVFNLRVGQPTGEVISGTSVGSEMPDAKPGNLATVAGAPFREYPIGEEERREESMHIAAVWLPPIQMEAIELPQERDVIHLEADIHALEANPNGFSRGAWIPYLTVRYTIEPTDSGIETLRGTFMPMVAKDGPHYGATIRMPGPGLYRLIYEIEPPSSNGLGRHSDPVTGVAPWWEPFQVEFEFDYPGPGNEKR